MNSAEEYRCVGHELNWMPEQTRRGGAAGGFRIRRVGCPAAMGPRRPARAAAAESNKENSAVRPTWQGSRARKSPLPEWYPRTPLRDITTIVNALERRRRLHLMQAARVAQANRDSEASPQNALLMSPSSQEPSVSIQTLPIDSTPCQAPTCLASFDSPIEHPLQMSCASSSSSPTDDSPPQISSISDNLTPRSSMQQTANEEKLCSSIDQIEKIVARNLKKTRKKEPVAKREMQRRTLMSMR